MPHKLMSISKLTLTKKASINIRNLKHFADIIKAEGFNAGKNLDAKKILKEDIVGSGTNSIFVGALKKIIGKKNRERLDNKFYNLRYKLTDADIKAGNKIHDFLKNRKSKVLQNLGEVFVTKHQVPIGKSLAGEADKLFEVRVPGATAPIEKTKKAILPFAGAMAVGSAAYKMSNKNKGGDMDMEKLQNDHKYKLIEKISSLYNDDNDNVIKISENVDLSKFSETISVASKMLKLAAVENRKLQSENEKLAIENQKLKSEIESKTKFDRATKLATLMNERKLIKKSDVESQVHKIIELDEAGYEMLKSAVENVRIKTEKDGVDTLDFLNNSFNSDKKTHSLADSIEDAIKNG